MLGLKDGCYYYCSSEAWNGPLAAARIQIDPCAQTDRMRGMSVPCWPMAFGASNTPEQNQRRLVDCSWLVDRCDRLLEQRRPAGILVEKNLAMCTPSILYSSCLQPEEQGDPGVQAEVRQHWECE